MSEVKNAFTPENKPGEAMWASRNISDLCDRFDTSPVFLDATIDCSSLDEGPLGGQTRITLRNEHLQYMLTW